MIVLGIDTSTSILSVAILHREKILGKYSVDSLRNHSSLLLLSIKSLIKKTKLKINNINLIAVSKGPGSFTGLRVGMSLAKGLAFSLNIPIIGISTLDALAKGVINGDCPRMGTVPYFICPILDAKKAQIYSALYKFENNELKLLTEYLTIEFDELCNLIERIIKGVPTCLRQVPRVLFTGEGLSIYKSKLKEIFGNSAIFVSTQQSVIATSIAKIGIERLKKGEYDSIYSLTPLYIRNPDVREH